MTALEQQIIAMYADIEACGGSFGDAVEHGAYNPYVTIRSKELTKFEKTGVSVALLVYLETAIDNSTYEDALISERKRLLPVIADGLLNDQPIVLAAAIAFTESLEPVSKFGVT